MSPRILTPGTILALAAGARSGELLVLSDSALLIARPGDVGSLTIEQLIELSGLPPAPHPSRVRAGTLVRDDTRVCFATTDLAGGWCLDAGRLSPLPGVPLPGRGGQRV